MDDSRGVLRYALLSIAASLVVIGLKFSAFRLTDSVGLLSDAAESGVNLFAALLTLLALAVARRPPDADHPFGHTKAEYLSAGAEGSLIVLAAIAIAAQSISQLLDPQPLKQIGIGTAITIVATLINLAVARVLIGAGRRYRSTALKADGRHLLADVWTSVGVIIGVALAATTGWLWLDSVVALLVSAHVAFSGLRLLREAADGLMDTALDDDDQARVEAVLNRYRSTEVGYHALRTRQSGAQRFVSVHIQVPGSWSVQRGHELLEAIERDLRRAASPISVITHLEPIEDPASWLDVALSRPD